MTFEVLGVSARQAGVFRGRKFTKGTHTKMNWHRKDRWARGGRSRLSVGLAAAFHMHLCSAFLNNNLMRFIRKDKYIFSYSVSSSEQ